MPNSRRRHRCRVPSRQSRTPQNIQIMPIIIITVKSIITPARETNDALLIQKTTLQQRFDTQHIVCAQRENFGFANLVALCLIRV